MRQIFVTRSTTVKPYIIITILSAIMVGVFVFNPLWSKYSPPFQIERVFPAITAPVDGPYYLRNAEGGYQWSTKEPLSLWFHPLLSVVLRIFPPWLPINYWFWIISVFSGIGSLALTWQVAKIYFEQAKPIFLPLILLVPGGLGLATGNAEIPSLFLNLALFLSVVRWKKAWLVVLLGILSILTKPNALYMIPILFVYFVSGKTGKDEVLSNYSLMAIIAILVGWLSWILIVDYNVGEFGAYWNTRISMAKYAAGNPINFFVQLVNSFVYTHDIRDEIRYSTALIIPVVTFWILGKIPVSNEVHRYALASGNLAMLIIALLFGNPNKIIVYTTTLPGYFSIYLIFFQSILNKDWLKSLVNRLVVLPIFILFCLFLVFVYVVGTPSGWYF